MNKVIKMFAVAVFCMLAAVGSADAYAPSAGDLTALGDVITDLALWFSPIIAIALAMLAYKRVKTVAK